MRIAHTIPPFLFQPLPYLRYEVLFGPEQVQKLDFLSTTTDAELLRER